MPWVQALPRVPGFYLAGMRFQRKPPELTVVEARLGILQSEAMGLVQLRRYGDNWLPARAFSRRYDVVFWSNCTALTETPDPLRFSVPPVPLGPLAAVEGGA